MRSNWIKSFWDIVTGGPRRRYDEAHREFCAEYRRYLDAYENYIVNRYNHLKDEQKNEVHFQNPDTLDYV